MSGVTLRQRPTGDRGNAAHAPFTCFICSCKYCSGTSSKDIPNDRFYTFATFMEEFGHDHDPLTLGDEGEGTHPLCSQCSEVLQNVWDLSRQIIMVRRKIRGIVDEVAAKRDKQKQETSLPNHDSSIRPMEYFNGDDCYSNNETEEPKSPSPRKRKKMGKGTADRNNTEEQRLDMDEADLEEPMSPCVVYVKDEADLDPEEVEMPIPFGCSPEKGQGHTPGTATATSNSSNIVVSSVMSLHNVNFNPNQTEDLYFDEDDFLEMESNEEVECNSGDQRNSCKYCGRIFFHAHELQDHLQSRHQTEYEEDERRETEEMREVCVCRVCGKGFKKKKYLFQHEAVVCKVVHSSTELASCNFVLRIFTCPFKDCSTRFSRSRDYNQHVSSVHRKNGKRCNVSNCGKVFYTSRKWNEHVKSHSGATIK